MPDIDSPVYFIELEFERTADQIIMHLNESPLGELRTPFAQPFAEDVLSAKLDAIERREMSRDELAAFGRQLYQALEQTRVGEAVRSAIREARRNRGQVILQLRFDEHSVELASLPWELLHDDRRYLLAAGAVDLVRYIAYPEAVVPLEVTPPLRVLQVTASPSDLPPIDVAKARASLDEVPNLVVERLPRATYDCLLERLEREPRLHGFHFDGHGALRDGQSFLYFEDEDGTSDAADAEAIHVALYHQVSLVVLNACLSSAMTGATVFSGLAPTLIEAGIPAVVGMQFSLSDDAAARFVKAFYSAVARFEPLTRALTYARKRLWRQDAWYIPTLYLRSQDKAGQLFRKVEVAADDELEELERQPAASPELAFPSQFVESFPYPIAVLCDEFNRTDRDEIRFQRLDALFCNSVKYLASVALAQYRQDDPDQESLRLWLRDLSSRFLSSWVKLLDEIAEHYRQRAETRPIIMGKLLDAYDRPVAEDTAIAKAHAWLAAAVGEDTVDVSLRTFIRRLTAYRQQSWEASTAHLDEEFYQVFLSVIQPAQRQLLELMTLITDYPLCYVERAHQRLDKWTYDMLDFRGPRPEPTIGQPFSVPSAGDEPPHKPFRLYLCVPSGEPLLNLHPLLISLHGRLYFLEAYGEDERLCYRPCYGGELFEPPDHLRLALMTCLEPEEQDEEETPSAELDRIEDQIEELEKTKPISLSLSDLIDHLDPDGRQAIEVALGEALRLGHFWLGVEFLLMALCRQKGQPFRNLLREVRMAPGTFRGLIRGVVGVRRDNWREQRDLASLGAEVLPNLREADPATLAESFLTDEEHPPVVTPRMMQVLRDAARLASEGQIGHGHLLLATLQHRQCLAVNLLLGKIHEAGWDLEEVLAWAMHQMDVARDDLTQGERGHADQPPVVKIGGVLGRYGRDLTQEALRGRVGEAKGESARRAMAQIGRILLQREANNPIILGDPGVGKTAVVEGVAWRLAGLGKGVVKRLAGKRIIELTVAGLLSGTGLRGSLEERLRQLLAEVKAADGQIIVFIDEIHSILGGGTTGGLSTVADALKPALARGEFPCIGATTVAEYRKHIEKDPALARRFTPVWLEEPSIDEAIQIVEQVAKSRLAEHHKGVSFASDAIEAAVRLSARYLHDECLPGKAIKVLDQACSGLVIPGSLSGEPEDAQSVVGGVVRVDAVLEIIADRTNIPLEQLGKIDKQRLNELEGKLKARVKGQDNAIEEVVRAVKRAGTGLTDPRRPLGVFLFAGSTGVGKTELALALAEALFDDEDAIFRLDMSEFMEKHQVARLIGAPPGYIGYEEEGQLTGRLRRRPYSVVLLDEMEKAHKDVQHLFLQLFDSGRLTDAHGNLADGRNAIFVMTTNLGAKEALLGFVKVASSYRDKLKAAIYDHFTLEFVNRIDRIVYFSPLDEDALVAIFDREFAPFQARLLKRGVEVRIPQPVKGEIARQVAKQNLGARPLRRVIEDKIVSPIVDQLLEGKIQAGPLEINQAPDLGSLVLPPSLDQAQEAAEPRPSPPPVSAGEMAPMPERELSPSLGSSYDYRASFERCFARLEARLAEKGIALEITEEARLFIYDPANLERRGDRPLEQAFDELVDKPLSERIEAGEFQTGDRVRVILKDDDTVEFEQVGEAQ
jgi:ATP-dependent Clp protease ATP-binding subunit ClpC